MCVMGVGILLDASEVKEHLSLSGEGHSGGQGGEWKHIEQNSEQH